MILTEEKIDMAVLSHLPVTMYGKTCGIFVQNAFDSYLKYAALQKALLLFLQQAIDGGVILFTTRLANQTELYLAQQITQLKKRYPHLMTECCLSSWDLADDEAIRQQIESSNSRFSASPHWTEECESQRDRVFLGNCDSLLIFVSKDGCDDPAMEMIQAARAQSIPVYICPCRLKDPKPPRKKNPTGPEETAPSI